MFHYGCCSTSYWNLILHTFHIINLVRPACWAQADLPIFHSNVTGTSFRLVQRLEMHFLIPTSQISLDCWHLQRGCGSNFWWCLRQKAMTLGRMSLEDRAYRGIPQCDPRMASGHNCHKLEDYQRCVYTIIYHTKS